MDARARFPFLAFLIAALCGFAPAAADSLTEIRGGRATLSFSPQHLAELGLSVIGSPQQATSGFGEEPRFGSVHSFEVADGVEIALDRAAGTAVSIPFDGGIAFRAQDPQTGESLPPVYLFDFVLEFLWDGDLREPRIRSADPSLPYPLELQSAGARIEREHGEITMRGTDLHISEGWARRLRAPHLAGHWIGGLDLRLSGARQPAAGIASDTSSRARSVGTVLDVKLGELYEVKMMARLGPILGGTAGLSATMTSCNNGNVDVPWEATMSPNHPLLGLAFFREKDGVLEQVGKSWIKHAWGVLPLDQCLLGCAGSGSAVLRVGCSDTYGAGANALQYFLGPREEVNPFTAVWEPWGSYFDAAPVDGLRDYFGVEPNAVVHTLEVQETDLANLNSDGSDARYFYEGAYYVADDDTTENNLGWRECTMEWNEHLKWDFFTIGAGLEPNPGPLVLTWGDQQDVATVAAGDGEVMLAVDVTDLGGGMWHYEYALYNRHSDRGIYSFSVPVDDAALSNVGFHDIDPDVGNDWSSTVQDGVITWSTDDFATDPEANALGYQTMYNFRFDADRAPLAATAQGGIFKPGPGTSVLLATQAPAAGVTAAPGLASAADGAFLVVNEPNPFSGSTRVRFSLSEEREVRLSVLDVRGRTVRILSDSRAPAGLTALNWDGRDNAGTRVASGIYFFRLESGNEVGRAKALLIR